MLRWQDWALFGGPERWNPWVCDLATYGGTDPRFPLPQSREELHIWRGVGTAKRYHALFPGTVQVGSLLVGHLQSFGQTGTATFGSSFLFPSAPVVLAGSQTVIPYAHLGGTGTDITYHFPMGLSNIRVLDRLT